MAPEATQRSAASVGTVAARPSPLACVEPMLPTPAAAGARADRGHQCAAVEHWARGRIAAGDALDFLYADELDDIDA
jgi:hypothetical protein